MKKDFSHIFEHDYPGFDNFCQEVLQPMFGDRIEFMSRSEDFIATTGKNEQADAANILSIQKVAEINPTEDQDNFDEIYVFDITMRDNCRIAQNRVGIQQLIRSQLMLDTNAFMLFHYEHPEGGRSWRFSYFYKSATDSMDRKRYTYVFGEGQSSKTANERFNLLSDALHGSKTVYNAAIEDAFSVEKLSDEFFYKYLGFYASFVKYITGEPTSQEEGDHKITERAFRETLAKMDALAMNDSHDLFNTSFASAYPDKKARAKTVRDYVKKMMGRLVFLHFLQRKGWMCSDRKFMLHLLQNTDHKDDFLDRVLEPLFFAVLNTHSKERLLKVEKHNAIIAGNKNKVEWDVAQIEAWSSIPYLNGGLFEEDHADGCRCIFPYEYFNALFDFFSQYNFTVDENDPSDAEVGVDPEMLSKIFESLLEDNKDKGAFYTPKEIVSYMCRSALSSYLKMPLSSLGVQESAVDAFVNNPQEHHDFTEEQRTVLLNSLRTVRICDPAIGSGAFPVGMMNLLYQCRRSLEGSDARAVDIKTDIIQHNIFGVDIEQGAVDIARLRFWLALVVDEEEAHALPNLDYRIVRGNSLLTTFNNEYINLGEDKPSNRTKLAKLKKQLAIAQGEYYNLSGEEKLQKEIDIKLLLLDIIAMRLDIDIKVADEVATDNPTLFDVPRNARQTKAQKEAIALAEQKRKSRIILKKLRDDLNDNKRSLIERARTDINFFDWDIIFSDVFAEKKGFDVVIGNPPYLRIQGIRENDSKFADYLVEKYSTATGKFDLYVTFIERAFRISNDSGIVDYIMPTKWTNSSYGVGVRKFVLAENGSVKMINFSSFQVFNASTYTGIQEFRKNCNGYFAYMQLTHDIESLPKLKQFLDNLSVDDFCSYRLNGFSSEPWALSSDKSTYELLEKINSYQKLHEILEYISQGTVSTGDDIFVMQGHFKNDFFVGLSEENGTEVTIERKLMKPLLKGDDIKRYNTLHPSYYILYPHHVVDGRTVPYTEEEMKSLFPLAYSYLLPFKDKLIEKKVRYKTNPTYWYSLHRAREISMFECPKILTPEISYGCNMTIDEEGLFHNTKVYTIIPKKQEVSNLNTLIAVLNSKLFWFYISNTGYVLRGGFFTFKTKYLENFPIPTERLKQDEKIGMLVHIIFSAKQSDPSADTTVLENEIDFMVYKLYGLTYDEVLVVDPETPITREQYEAKKL